MLLLLAILCGLGSAAMIELQFARLTTAVADHEHRLRKLEIAFAPYE